MHPAVTAERPQTAHSPMHSANAAASGVHLVASGVEDNIDTDISWLASPVRSPTLRTIHIHMSICSSYSVLEASSREAWRKDGGEQRRKGAGIDILFYG